MATYLTEAQFNKYCTPVTRFLNENRPLRGWALHSASLYKTGQTGLVTVLYENGLDLGDPEANLAAVDANEEWFYDSAIDTTYLFNDTTAPNNSDVQAGEDHVTFVADMFSRASNLIDRELDATHEIPLQKDGDGNYEELIIQITAYKAAKLITAAIAPELHEEYKALLSNIDGDGLLDRIKAGDLKFAYEIDQTSSSGEITETTLTGTMRLVELRGRAWGIARDDILVKITKTGAFGTSTYSTFIADSATNTLQSLVQTEDEIIDGLFQPLAYGVEGRFEGASATLDDAWSVVVRGKEEEVTNPTVKSVVGGRGGSVRRRDPWLCR